MARRGKSISDINSQANRIMVRAARQYGYSERQRNIRDKAKATASKYVSNIFGKHFKSNTISGTQVNTKVSRRTYMGLANG